MTRTGRWAGAHPGRDAAAARPEAGGDERQLVVQVVAYFPPHLGGMEVVAKALAEGLAERGPVEVLTARTGASSAPRMERRGNLTIRRLFTLEVEHVPFMPTLPLHLLRLPRRCLVHVHIAQAYVPEMVWLAGLIRRRPYLAHFHLDCDPTGRFGCLFLAYKRWVLGGVLRAATRVIVLSAAQADFVAQRYGVLPDRTVILPNGIGTQFYGEPRSAPDHNGRFRLLFVGRCAPQKNLPRLLHAVASVTAAVELVIVGDGDQRSMLERLSREMRLTNVRIVGPQTGTELVDWYRWADAFVLSSDKEGMSVALLEAMAAGLPVVATRVQGISDTVGDDALLAEPDPLALAQAVDRLATDPLLWTALSHRSTARAAELTLATQVQRLRKVYEDVAP